MGTAFLAALMAISTGLTAIVFAFFGNGATGVHDTKALLAGTFHLGDGSHGWFLTQHQYYNI
jgi:hypothetical protein